MRIVDYRITAVELWCVEKNQPQNFTVSGRHPEWPNTIIPHDIPPNADRVVLTYNAIRTVTSLPPLPQLYALDLSYNFILYVAWESLCNLPALEVLYLTNNRLQSVKLDTVIEYLPRLRNVYFARNKLVSCTLYEVGWPRVTAVSLRGNTAPCDCSGSFYGLTERTCLERGVDARCSSCSACFFLSGRKRGGLYCKRPDEANQLPSSNVSTHLKECERQQSIARAATTELAMVTTEEGQRQMHSSEMDASSTKDEVKSLQPTTRPKTTSTASIMMGTEKAKTNNLQTSEGGTLPTDGTHHSSAATLSTIKTSDKTYSLATIQANPTQTGISKSSPTSKELKTPEDKELPIAYITIVVFESVLTLMFVTFFARLRLMRYRRPDHREEINRGHSIPLHQISSAMANSTHNITSAGGDDHGHLANSTNSSTSAGGGDQEHLANSTHGSITAGGGNQEHLANSTHGSTRGDQEHLANSTHGSTSAGGGDQEHLANSTYGSTSAGGGDQEHLANSTYGSTSAGGGDQEHLANSTYGSTSAGGGDQEYLANSTYGSTSAGGGDQEHLANSTYGSKTAGGGIRSI
ncbi:ISLR2 [Branchiostoma lanceolatum]|uniref:ISLR2 protein n=1 Tax=Branchiostoma lanceolatum TaxID=7740 RepID=A0A8K0ES76_BRALA|nr:ISLR2 [Branchiostoma lanceolatum]